MYDICVIGGGPAGLTAALYSLRAGRSTLLMEEKTFGGQMAETSVIENMPGSPDAQGWELAMRFGQQVEQLGVSPPPLKRPRSWSPRGIICEFAPTATSAMRPAG